MPRKTKASSGTEEHSLINIEVVNRHGKKIHEMQADSAWDSFALKRAYERERRLSRHRQRWELASAREKVVLQGEGKSLAEFGVVDGARLTLKDMGPQISWRTVFVVEYAGPIFIYLFFFLRPGFVYGAGARDAAYSVAAQAACAAWVLHYLKRELETFFVHRFGNDTMPMMNIFKNSGYYWGAAAAVAYFVNHPLFTPPGDAWTWAWLGVFAFCELSNGYCHLILRGLRKPGTRERNIPRGYLFEYVSCANYTFEVAAWVAFSFATMTLASFGFALMGALQMYVWAKQKHRRYKKEFQDYPKNRTAMIPFIA